MNQYYSKSISAWLKFSEPGAPTKFRVSVSLKLPGSMIQNQSLEAGGRYMIIVDLL